MSAFPFAGVVFDVDGVLFDTERLSRKSWEEIGAEMGWPQARALHDGCTGQTQRTIRRYLQDRLGPEFPGEEFMARTSRRTQDYMERDGVPLMPGVRETLAFLNGLGAPTALATSTGYARTMRRLELSGLGPCFRAVVTGDDVSHSKPHPEIYLTACAKLGVEPGRTLAVEDSLNGVRSACAAGMPTALIPDLVLPTPEIEAMAWRRFRDLLELRAALEP